MHSTVSELLTFCLPGGVGLLSFSVPEWTEKIVRLLLARGDQCPGWHCDDAIYYIVIFADYTALYT